METSSRVTPLRLDREDEKKMLPCRFFANGYCHKGNRCRFYHPLNIGLSSMIRVPSLPPHFNASPHEMNSVSRVRPPPHDMASPIMSNMRAPPVQSHEMSSPMSRASYFGPPHEMRQQQQLQQQQQQQPQQNTIFSHIDWSEFLAPGQTPPPPTHVPDERHSPARKSEMCTLVKGMLSETPSSSSSNEDMPPEGRVSQRKLTAKEELHMKVQEIAKELAEEPLAPIHSLDCFFRNFTFNV